MNDSRELEAKFEADGGALARLLTLESFGAFRLIERSSKIQRDLYYDTADGHLRDAGATLRIRRRSTGAQMTFKGDRQPASQGHAVSRLEDEVDLAAAAISDLDDEHPLALRVEPSPLIRARALTGEHELLPRARLLTDRSVLIFADGAGTQIELALDRCEATRLADGRVVRFSEVELEFKQGGHDALFSAVEALGEAVAGLRPSTKTKLERAFA